MVENIIPPIHGYRSQCTIVLHTGGCGYTFLCGAWRFPRAPTHLHPGPTLSTLSRFLRRPQLLTRISAPPRGEGHPLFDTPASRRCSTLRGVQSDHRAGAGHAWEAIDGEELSAGLQTILNSSLLMQALD